MGHNRSCSSFVGGDMAAQVGIGGAAGLKEGQQRPGRKHVYRIMEEVLESMMLGKEGF